MELGQYAIEELSILWFLQGCLRVDATDTQCSGSAQGISSSDSLWTLICAMTRSLAISSKVWDMEPSLVWVVKKQRPLFTPKIAY